MSQWRNLLETAIEKNKHIRTSRFVALATLGKDGKPKNRNLVFRGLVDEKIKFTTDIRSEKIAEISLNPFVELCWYFPETWEQFRISGKMEIHTGQTEIAKTTFSELSDAARATFTWPTPAVGQLTDQTSEEEYPSNLYPRSLPLSNSFSALHEKALSNFCVLLLVPEGVDYVHLTNNKKEFFSVGPKL